MYFCKKVINGMKKQAIYLLLMILTLCSCMGNKRYDALMHRADSIMNINDDSAKVAIQMLDSIKPQLSDFTKAQRMKYELLYHKAMNKADMPFTSDSIMKEVADYYEHHGSANEKMLAYYVLGCVYRGLHEAPLALEYYNKATEQADTTAADCDYATLFRVYGQMGLLFDKQYFPYQELAAYNNAVKYAYLAKDTFNAIINFQNKEAAYAFLNKIDSAIAINLQAAKMFKSCREDNNANIAYGCNFDYYIDKGDFKNAQKAFDAYMSTNYEGNTEYPDSKAFLLYLKGKYYMMTDQLDSANNCLQQSLTSCLSFSNKAATTKALSQYYLKINQPTLASKWALKSMEYQDSDFIESRQDQLQQVQAMYDYNRHQKSAILAEQKATQRANIIYLLIIGCFILLALLTYIYWKKLTIRKKRNEATQLLYEDSLLKSKKLQEELVKLKEENDQALSQAVREKEESLNQLKSEIKDIREKFSNPLLSDTDVILKNTSIYKKLQYLEMHPKENMESKDWNELETTIEQLIPSFIPIFKERLANKNDYHICLLIKLRFSLSFIANLLGLSPSGVSASRKKMLAHLCNKIGSPKDFDEYVRQIS